MARYAMNINLHGYDKLTIENRNTDDIRNDIVIVAVNKALDEQLSNYYKIVEQLLKNKNRVILLSSEDDNSLLKPLASLMVCYSAYDIYTVPDISGVDSIYASDILKRNPCIEEVQNYIGGDVTAYNDLITILYGIESLVKEGKVESLKKFLEEHILSIAEFTTTFNNMKKKCDMYDSGELIDKITALKNDADKLGNTIKEQNEELMNTRQVRDTFKVRCAELQKENDRLKSANEDLESNTSGAGAVIRNYSELNTRLVPAIKTRFILYFKEISYVPYVNTLVTEIMNILESNKLGIKTKLLIYDCNTNLYSVYNKLRIATGQSYITEKETFVRSLKRFVVTEPNQSIITDMLTSDQRFDVLVIYDRMKQSHDLISGNNVSKFYIINSKNDYEAVVSGTNKINIPDTSWIITHASSSITGVGKPDDKAYLDIPYINGFSTLSPSSKTSKYVRLQTQFLEVPLINTIFTKSKLMTISSIKSSMTI